MMCELRNVAFLAACAGGSGGAGGGGPLNQPRQIVFSGGVGFIADGFNHAIRKLDTGVLSLLAGRIGVTGGDDGTGNAARFHYPYGLCFAGTDLYVADAGGNIIRKVTTTGVVTTLAGAYATGGGGDGTGSAARFSSPYGICYDGTDLYVAVANGGAIRKVTTAGVVTTLAGLHGAGGTTDGTGSAARFNIPWAICFDGTDLYVADNDRIRKVTLAGVVTTLATGFNKVNGVCFDGTDLYVTDRDSHIVQKVTLAGVVTTLAGSAGLSGNVDGTGSAARFYSPAHITWDGTDLYVADTANHAIRKVTIAGVVTTLYP